MKSPGFSGNVKGTKYLMTGYTYERTSKEKRIMTGSKGNENAAEKTEQRSDCTRDILSHSFKSNKNKKKME